MGVFSAACGWSFFQTDIRALLDVSLDIILLPRITNVAAGFGMVSCGHVSQIDVTPTGRIKAHILYMTVTHHDPIPGMVSAI